MQEWRLIDIRIDSCYNNMGLDEAILTAYAEGKGVADGTARFSSALSVDNFVKKTSVIHYSESAFRKEAADIVRLANTEGLTAHANAVKIRSAPRQRRD